MITHKLIFAAGVLLAISFVAGTLFAQEKPLASPMNINNFNIWTRYDGLAGRNPATGERTRFPRDAAGALYQDGFIWGGYVNESGTPELRVGGFDYRAGTIPGAIIAPGVAEDSTSASVRVYRIRKDFATDDLHQDAADFFNKPLNLVTTADIEQLRAQYQKDWDEWPADKGAPFYDNNGNGVRDDGEAPGLQEADMVLWFVINDLDAAKTAAFYHSKPIGLETQITWWAYQPTSSALENTVFIRYRLLYKGTAQSTSSSTIEQMYFSKKVDPDLGNFADDLVGCDTTLSLGFVYNSLATDVEYESYNIAPPVVGYALLQGPIVLAGSEESAEFDFKARKGFNNAPMTSFIGKYSGTPFGDPVSTNGIYNWIRGYLPLDDLNNPLLYSDHNMQPTKFAFYGDPVAESGWIDGEPFIPAGDRRFLVNTGPFNMARGDTQEVVYALVGGPGSDYRGNVNVVKYFVRIIRQYYPDLAGLVTAVSNPHEPTLPDEFRLLQNYPNPFNPETIIEYALPHESAMRLVIYDVLGREVRVLEDGRKFAGVYRVVWDGRDGSGHLVPSGLYFYKLKADETELMHKLLLMR